MTGMTNQSTKGLLNTIEGHRSELVLRFVTQKKVREYESIGWKVFEVIDGSPDGRQSVIMEKYI